MFCLLVLMTVPSFLGRSDLFYFLCAVTLISLPLCSVFLIFSVSLKLSKLFTYGKLLRALMSLFFTHGSLFVSSLSDLRQGDQGWLQNPKWWHNTNLCNRIIVFSKVFPLDPPSCEALNNPTRSLCFLFLSWMPWTYRALRDRSSANYFFISGNGKG